MTEPHNNPTDPQLALTSTHQCYFCKAPYTNQDPKFPNFDAHCGRCKTTQSYSDNKLFAYRMYVKMNKSACFLYVHLAEERAEMLMNSKYMSIPWEVAKTITPENIQKRLKTIMVFS